MIEQMIIMLREAHNNKDLPRGLHLLMGKFSIPTSISGAVKQYKIFK